MHNRKRYTKEFKLEAVRLFEQGDRVGAELARELGVRRNQLYKWKAELGDKGQDRAFRGPGRNAAIDEQSELTLLRRKLAKLEEENTILKKAAAYFARELP